MELKFKFFNEKNRIRFDRTVNSTQNGITLNRTSPQSIHPCSKRRVGLNLEDVRLEDCQQHAVLSVRFSERILVVLASNSRLAQGGMEDGKQAQLPPISPRSHDFPECKTKDYWFPFN
jgi:hypothetical protein